MALAYEVCNEIMFGKCREVINEIVKFSIFVTDEPIFDLKIVVWSIMQREDRGI